MDLPKKKSVGDFRREVINEEMYLRKDKLDSEGMKQLADCIIEAIGKNDFGLIIKFLRGE